MHFLVAGGAARLGVALGAAFLERGHDVTLADRFVDLDTRRAASWWSRLPAKGEVTELHSGELLGQLKPVLSRVDAIVIVGNPRDESLDLDLTIALADATVSLSRATPIVRLTALDASAGTQREPVVIPRGRARLRDFPFGIPVERTAMALGEADRALRLVSTMRDQHCVLLRAAECLAPGRFEFEAWEAASLALVSSLIEVQGFETSPKTTVDLIDAVTLAAAVERCVRCADTLDGQILHLTGGPGCRLDLRQILQQQSLLLGAAAAWGDADLDSIPMTSPAAFLLDDIASRRALGFSDLTWAPRAIAKFHRFASAHSQELSLPSLRFA